jgi:hypothetical protein
MFFVLDRPILPRLFPTIGFQIITEVHSTDNSSCLEIDKLSKTEGTLLREPAKAIFLLHNREATPVSVSALFGILLLVFNRKQPMLDSMDPLPWYRRLFSPAPESDLKTALAKAGTGDADAQFGLGLKYSAGTEAGMARDLAQAAEWYEKAANQDHALAQFNLSLMFASGQGVPQNDTTALMWTRKAAEGGDAGAQFNLGTRYHRASMDCLQKDSAESRIEAYKWFHLASAQGYKGSDAACERVTLGMTREEVADGNQRTAAFAVRKASQSRNDSFRTTTE